MSWGNNIPKSVKLDVNQNEAALVELGFVYCFQT